MSQTGKESRLLGVLILVAVLGGGVLFFSLRTGRQDVLETSPGMEDTLPAREGPFSALPGSLKPFKKPFSQSVNRAEENRGTGTPAPPLQGGEPGMRRPVEGDIAGRLVDRSSKSVQRVSPSAMHGSAQARDPKAVTGSALGRVLARSPGGPWTPVAGVPVRVRLRTKGGIVHRAVSDRSGRYIVRDLPPGSACVHLPPESAMYFQSAERGILVEAGRTSVLDLRLQKVAWVPGRCKDESGRPVSGAVVTLTDLSDKGASPAKTTVEPSDVKGFIRLPAGLTGSYRLTARTASGAKGMVEPFSPRDFGPGRPLLIILEGK